MYGFKRYPGITVKQFYNFLFMERPYWNMNRILRYGKLTQQYFVDMYMKMESSRLKYMLKPEMQEKYRISYKSGLKDSIWRRKSLSEIGKRLVLSPSFPGGYRYLKAQYKDSICVVAKTGIFVFYFFCNIM